jgi:N-methylhydantoinase A
MARIVVPPHAGVLSAIGLALAPERRERIASHIIRVREMSAAELSSLLEREVSELRHDAPQDGMESRWWLRARYEGQGHELDVPVSPGDNGISAAERFVALHAKRTGFTLDRPVECISVRTAVVGLPWPVKFQRTRRSDEFASDIADSGPNIDDGFEMERELRGPAVVRLPDATLRVASGWVGRALPTGGWLMERA